MDLDTLLPSFHINGLESADSADSSSPDRLLTISSRTYDSIVTSLREAALQYLDSDKDTITVIDQANVPSHLSIANERKDRIFHRALTTTQ